VQIPVTRDDASLLVRPDVARRQIDQETKAPDQVDKTIVEPLPPEPDPTKLIKPPKPKRYHGTVILDPARVGRDAGRIAEEVVTHLAGLVGSSVRVTIEIEAEIPEGAPNNVVRTVTENSRTHSR